MKLLLMTGLILSLLTPAQVFASANLSPLLPQLQENLSNLHDVNDELEKASGEAKPIVKRINFLIKKINLTAIFGFQGKCERRTSADLLKLEKQILKLDTRKCKPDGPVRLQNRSFNSTVKCITEDVVNNYLPRLQQSFQEVKSVFLIDENNNNISDICEGEGL